MARKIEKGMGMREREGWKEGRKETENGNANLLSSIYTSVKYLPLSVQKTKQNKKTMSQLS